MGQRHYCRDNNLYTKCRYGSKKSCSHSIYKYYRKYCKNTFPRRFYRKRQKTSRKKPKFFGFNPAAKKEKEKTLYKFLNLKRISRPGLRIYSNSQRIPRILGGMGIVILSTSRGLMTDREARIEGIGGEILCYIW
uniref:Small ribosomal subunit protein uS8c n=1 Tax=Teucrium stocksianum subsp. stenophyllum TaxID=2172031 RepID=A0A4Y6I4H4_9LAMI|nr:ribosomal protein S8 [Teucrium stocksianum subsp. stenophyllum]